MLFGMVRITIIVAASLIYSAGALAQEPGNLEDEKVFIEAFANREGVIARPSGLLIRIIERGTGPVPNRDSMVRVEYEGSLINGFVFDSTASRGEPADFNVGSLIRGWTEALLLMQVGSKWEIVMPADIGYGREGAGGGNIPPGATLNFKLELLEIL